nr:MULTISPECIES: N-acetylmuramoyl-L-alanine amidase [unclassified Pseudonocardia]
MCHHTAGAPSGESPSLNVVKYGTSSLAGPLSQLYLSRSGIVHVVAAGLSYHAGVVAENWQTDSWSIGIEAEATGTSAWPAYQYDAYARLCKALIDHYGLPVPRVIAHKEAARPVGRKIDPNFDMVAFRRLVASIGDNYLTPEQDRMLREVHRELTQRLRRRIEGSSYTDTVLGYAMNADSFGYRGKESLDRIEARLDQIEGRLDT